MRVIFIETRAFHSGATDSAIAMEVTNLDTHADSSSANTETNAACAAANIGI